MKDSTIFKLAAGAGLLAFVGRLIFIQPDDLGVGAGIRGPRPTDEVSRLVFEGDYRGALRVASIRQREDYLDQRGWSRIAAVLTEMEAAADDRLDAAAALEVFRETAPQSWLEETGALGWAAYFLGYQIREEEAEEASIAWRIGAADFERLIREQASTAVAWDWLYRARSYMRLGEDAAAREALRDASNWAEAALRADESADAPPVESPIDFLRTYGRTWAAVGGVVEAESIWSRLNGAMLELEGPIGVATEWQRYARTLSRSEEDTGAELAMEMSFTALERADADDPEVARRAAPLWRNAARRFDRRESAARADETWRRALAAQRLAAERTGDPSEWIDYAEILAERGRMDEALDAIERGVGHGYTNADRLWSAGEFETLRNNERFQESLAVIEKTLDEMYPSRRDATETPPRLRDARRPAREGR